MDMLGLWMEPHLMILAAAGNDTSGTYWILIALAMLIASYLLMRPKKRKDPLSRPASHSSLAQERGVERQMQSLLVELTQMAQQISAQLDTRSAKLEALIREADEKIRQLSALKGTDTASPVEPAPPQEERYLEIYAMADHGAKVPEIAEKLDRPAGEIELILALRPSRSTPSKERQ